MTARSFLILAVLTLVVAAWTVMTVAQRQRADTIVGSGELLTPALIDAAEKLDTIVVRGGGDAMATIRRRGTEWLVDERDGYPADPAIVRALVTGMADLEKVEAKTDRPDRYAQIGVQGVAAVDGDSAPETNSREVTLIDEDGEIILQLIVGDVAAGLGGETGRYVRTPHNARAWLVRGAIDPKAVPRDWLARSIADVPAALVQKIVVRHPDGETITASRASPEDAVFSVAELPHATRLRRPRDVDGLAGTLEGLTLEDVKPVDQVPFPPAGTIFVTFTTFDGMVVTLDLTQDDGETWARLMAGTTPTEDADATNALEAVQALNARTAGWAYRLAQRSAEILQRRLDELVIDEPPGS